MSLRNVLGIQTLFVSAICLWLTPTYAANNPAQTFTLDGELLQAGTTSPLLDASAKITVDIVDPTKTCLLYEETQTVNTSATNGYYTIQVGSNTGDAKRTASDPGLTMAQVFQDSSAVTAVNVPGQTCASSTYTPSAGDARYLRITVTPSSTGVADVLSPDTVMDSVPTAIVAETVQGLAPSNLLQVNTTAPADLSQANLENIFSTTNFPKLQSLVAGTSIQYMVANPSSSVSFNGQAITNVGTPSAATDAATKGYSDSYIAGLGTNISGLGVGTGNGEILTWDGATGKWIAQAPAGDTTKLPLAGGTMAGAINMGGNDITNTGYITMNPDRYIQVSNLTSAQETTLIATPLGAGNAGAMWYNSTDNDMKLWNGSAARALIQNGGQPGAIAIGPSDANALTFDTNNTAHVTIDSSGNVGVGTTSPTSLLDTYSAGDNNFSMRSGGTVQFLATTGITRNMFGTTATGAAIGTNTNNPFWIGTGNATRMYFDTSGNVGIGTTTPGSLLDINGAMSYRGMTAPAVSPAGQGRMYFDSTANTFMISQNGSSYIPIATTSTSSFSNVSSISNTGGNITLAPAAATGSVLVNSGTASSGSTSGALVVTGGVGVSGDIYSGGSINAGSTMSAVTSLTTPQIYGSNLASGNIKIDGTSNATPGNVLLSTAGGRVGVGTTTPQAALDVTGAIDVNGVNGIRYPASDSTAGASIAIGPSALSQEDALGAAAYSNTGVGYQVMSGAMTTATQKNSALGAYALKALTGGAENTAVGFNSMFSTTNGIRNTAIGLQSLTSVTTGMYNTGLGWDTGMGLSSETYSTAVGASAMMWHGGSYNTIVGAQALGVSGTGGYNSAVGSGALNQTGAGIQNSALGYNAGHDITTGSQNIIIGAYPTIGVGVTTGSNNILIGDDVRPLTQAGSNQLNIGNLIYGSGLGSGATTSTGDVGIGTTSPEDVLQVNGLVHSGAGPANDGTYVTVNAASTDTTITVNDTTDYPSSGTLLIGSEFMHYAGKTATTFTGLTRGLYGTTAAGHAANPNTKVESTLLMADTNGTQWPRLSVFNDGGVTMGENNVINGGGRNIAIGYNNKATGYMAAAIGPGPATATNWGSFATGAYSTASGSDAYTMGFSLTSSAYGEFVTGFYNAPTGSENANSWVAGNPMFVIGNGTSTTPSNALMVFQNGQMLVNGNTTVAIPSGSAALTAMGSTADGTAASVNATDSAGKSLFYVRDDGNVGVGTATPSSALDVNGAMTLEGMAAPALSSAGEGRIYFDSTSNQFEISQNGGAYATLATSGGAGGGMNSTSALTFNSNTDNSGADGGFNFQSNGSNLLTIANNGDSVFTSTTASTSSSTGAVVVDGGVGVSGNINAGGNLTAPQIYGSGVSGGDVKIDGTSNATKGDVLINSAGGNVGIGTTSPGAYLDVRNVSGGITFQWGSSSAVKGVLDYGGAGATIYGSTGQTLALGANGSASALTINTSNDITAINALSVGGVISTSSYFEKPGTAAPALFMNSAGSSFGYIGNRNAHSWELGYGSLGSLGTSVLSWTDSGDVGIGTTTPAGILDVEGGTASSGNGTNINLYAQNGNGTNMNGGNIILMPGAATGTGTPGQVSIGAAAPSNFGYGTQLYNYGVIVSDYTNGGDFLANSTLGHEGNYNFGQSTAGMGGMGVNSTSDYVRFYTNSAERLRIDGSGNVGIGTTSPNANLQVVNPTADSLVAGFMSGSANGDYADVAIGNKTAWAGTIRGIGQDPVTGDSLAFTTQTGGIFTEKMRITGTGDVGIGTATPGALLHLYSATTGGDMLKVETTNAGPWAFAFLDDAYSTTWTNAAEGFQDASGNFSLRTGGSGGVTLAPGGTSWAAWSDRRLKTNVKSLPDSTLNDVMKLRPVTYSWKDVRQNQLQGQQLGLIAQEVKTVFPQAVTPGGKVTIKLKSGKKETIKHIMALNYTALISPIVKALQEFYQKWTSDSQDVHRELASLRAVNVKQDQEIKAQEKQIQQLQREIEEIRRAPVSK